MRFRRPFLPPRLRRLPFLVPRLRPACTSFALPFFECESEQNSRISLICGPQPCVWWRVVRILTHVRETRHMASIVRHTNGEKGTHQEQAKSSQCGTQDDQGEHARDPDATHTKQVFIAPRLQRAGFNWRHRRSGNRCSSTHRSHACHKQNFAAGQDAVIPATPTRMSCQRAAVFLFDVATRAPTCDQQTSGVPTIPRELERAKELADQHPTHGHNKQDHHLSKRHTITKRIA